MTSFLIVRLGSLGDVVHAIPFASALRASFPTSRIDWLVDPRYRDLLELVDGLDHRVPVDPRALFRGAERSAFLRTIADLRRRAYDVAFDLQGLVKSAVLSRAAGARRVVGFPRAYLREPLAALLYTETPEPRGTGHVIRQNLALLAAVGVRDERLRFPLAVPCPAPVAAVLARHPQGFVLINPGAAWPNKRWPAARFGAAAAAIATRHALRSVVLWGPDEHALATAVVGASAGAAELAPPTRITDIAALARGARLMISGDTGPLHVGAAVGTPIVALFGPTSPERNGPWSPEDVSISRLERCACVYERRCRRGTPCIDDIGVDEVLDAVARRLATAQSIGRHPRG